MGRDPKNNPFYVVFDKFQPTRPHGARLEEWLCEEYGVKFQPTRPHGARPPVWCPRWHQASFNPRARMGRDAADEIVSDEYIVSTHAPAWGATDTRLVQYT